MPLITQSEITKNSLMQDFALQRSAHNQLRMQLLALREGLELSYNPALHRTNLIEHTVIRGETLPEIAVMYYGSPERWLAIVEQNNLDEPYDVWPGQVLIIPGASNE